jgi:hypothetical protein
VRKRAPGPLSQITIAISSSASQNTAPRDVRWMIRRANGRLAALQPAALLADEETRRDDPDGWSELHARATG